MRPVEKRYKKIVALLAVVVACLFIFLYIFMGLGSYIKALMYVNGLGGGERQAKYLALNGNPKDRQYSGILAYTDRNGFWVWHGYSLHHFSVFDKTSFSYYEVCRNNLYKSLEASRGGTIKKQVTDSFLELKKWMGRGVGNFIEISIANPSAFPGAGGKIREVWINDWWPFMDKILAEQCTR